ncbi:hypothetical protein E3N88_15072 [Mikania micrantha]|uniref:F-box domain-containing protein n=1 Tax=Mikania micrantha TaxID=192012 RepID=A0A5N6P3J1_9ASTR|nr:hypothetical protein E3N88_15072 [Mikania micrantha]
MAEDEDLMAGDFERLVHDDIISRIFLRLDFLEVVYVCRRLRALLSRNRLSAGTFYLSLDEIDTHLMFFIHFDICTWTDDDHVTMILAIRDSQFQFPAEDDELEHGQRRLSELGWDSPELCSSEEEAVVGKMRNREHNHPPGGVVATGANEEGWRGGRVTGNCCDGGGG